jgi:hypothetical protein
MYVQQHFRTVYEVASVLVVSAYSPAWLLLPGKVLQSEVDVCPIRQRGLGKGERSRNLTAST